MPAPETFVQPAPVVLAEPAAAATAFETDDAEPLFAPYVEPAFAARQVNVPALDEPEFEEPIFEFAPAPEPVHAFGELMHAHADQVEREEAVEDTEDTDDDLDDDENLIDLSDDLAEISPETSTDELFDGERVGVYTMPSFDTDEFDIDADVDMPIAARSRYDVIEKPRAEPAAPLDLAEFGDDELLAAFGAIEAPEAVVAPVTTPEAPSAPIVAEVIAAPDAVEIPEIAAPVAARTREDGWLTMGIRHVWAWPTLEGVTVEAPSFAALEEFSDALAPAAPLPKPPVALPRPHVVAPAPKTDHMEWAELIASLRQDIERRRNQPAPAAQVERPVPAPAVVHNDLRAKRKSTPIQDEWGFFDPHQCGFAALLEKLDQITDADDDLGGRRPA